MFCHVCGTQLPEGTKFCVNCGKNLEQNTEGSYTSSRGTQYQQSNQGYSNHSVNSTYAQNAQFNSGNNNDANIPAEYRPISMWGYFGYELLFAIPLIGWILLLVFSFGGTVNKNLRNFARSYFCLLIVGFVIVLFFWGMIGSRLAISRW